MSGYSVRPNSAPEASASFLAVVDRLETCDRWDGGMPMHDQAGARRGLVPQFHP